MFRVVAQYLVSEDTTSNYYNRSSDSALVNNYPVVDTNTLTIFDDTIEDQSLKLINPTLQLADNSAGSFEFTLPTVNVGYGKLGRMISEITVYQNEEVIWRGRILSEEIDMYNRKKYFCEGELAYFNDTRVEPCDYQDYDLGKFIREIIEQHNSQLVDDNGSGTIIEKYHGISKTFQVGVIEIHNNKKNEDFVKDGWYATNFETTLEVLNDICEKYKGHLCVRHQNGVRYLDVLEDLKYQSMAGQTINFGKNLMDFTRKFDMSDIATAVLALGKLPDDFKPKDKELADHAGSMDNRVIFHEDLACSSWVDGFQTFHMSGFNVIRNIEISGGAKFIISSHLPQGMVTISYVDANGNYISNVKHDGSQWIGKEQTAPEDAARMSVASYAYPVTDSSAFASVELVAGQENVRIVVPRGTDMEAVKADQQATTQIANHAGFESTTQVDVIADAETKDSYITYREFVSDSVLPIADPEWKGVTKNSPLLREEAEIVPIISPTDGELVLSDDGYQMVKNRDRYVFYKKELNLDVNAAGSGTATNAIIEERGLITYGLHINTVEIDVNAFRDQNSSEKDQEVKFIYTCRMDYPFMVYAILDKNGAIIDSKTVSEIHDKATKHNDFEEETITVPPKGVKLFVSGQASSEFHVWSYNKLYDKVNMYLTVEEVNDGNPYVVNDEAVNTYGWIAKSIEFEVEDKTTLLSKARQYLQEVQFDKLTMDVKAVDLAYLSDSVRSFHLYEVVRCVSAPHGLDSKFPVTAVNLPLDKPDQVSYTLGDNHEPDYTEANNDTALDLVDIINKIPSRESVLVEAKRNAAEIMNRYCHGYVTIVEDDERFGSCIYISDSEDYKNANRMWLWNLNGLSYSKDGGSTFDLALTMDGSIVADFITAGTMSADRIRSGLLIDLEGKNYWNLETGDIALGLNLKTTRINGASTYYGEESGTPYPTSDEDIELGSWIFDRTCHDFEFRNMFGSGLNLVDGIQGFSGDMTDENGDPVYEEWYNPKTGLKEKRVKQRYWLYISASMISTGILRGKTGRTWFDLNGGALWVCGPSRLELDKDGNVLYPNGDGGWSLDPSTIAKHIKFEEGALFGYSNAEFSPEIAFWEVNEDYESKDSKLADLDHDQKGKHRIFEAANITGGTCEGFLDLVSTYGKDENDNPQYDVLLSGSHRVHINYGDLLLIGNTDNLFDIDPKILVTADDKTFALGNPIKPSQRVDLEVYGNAKIGHKLDEISYLGELSPEDQALLASISVNDVAPNKEVADKFKGDLTVNGSAVFGRNYYVEEVEQTNSSRYSSASTRNGDGRVIANGTDNAPAGTYTVTKKKYYDDVTFYANVSIKGEGGADTDHLKVNDNLEVGAGNQFSLWDNSWKYTNKTESYSIQKSYSATDGSMPDTVPDDFNSINGDLLINGRVQFVGGTVGMPDGRLVIGARESGNNGKFYIPQTQMVTQLDNSKLYMKDYYDLVGGYADNKRYNIYNCRFVVEGNSLLYGDVNVLKGLLSTESFEIGEYIPVSLSDLDNLFYNKYHYLYFDRSYRVLLTFAPTIYTADQRKLSAYNHSMPTTSIGAYYDSDYPLVLNSPLIYEGINETDGFVIDTSRATNTLTGVTRPDGTKKITLKSNLYFKNPSNNNYHTGYIDIDGKARFREVYVGRTGDADIDDTIKYASILYDGKIHATGLTINAFDGNGNIIKAWSAIKYTGSGTSASDYKLQMRTNQFFLDYMDPDDGNNTYTREIRLKSKLLNGTTNSRERMMTFDGGIAPGYIDICGYSNYVGNQDGSIYARRVEVYNNQYRKVASLDNNGGVTGMNLSIGKFDTSANFITYGSMNSSGELTITKLTLNHLSNGTVDATKTPIEFYSEDDTYKLKITADRLYAGSNYIYSTSKPIGSSGSKGIMVMSSGIAPQYIDVTDYNKLAGSTPGWVYAKGFNVSDSNGTDLATIDSYGDLKGRGVYTGSSGSFTERIDSSGVGKLASLNINGTERIDSNGVGKFLSLNISGTERISSAGSGHFAGLYFTGSLYAGSSNKLVIDYNGNFTGNSLNINSDKAKISSTGRIDCTSLYVNSETPVFHSDYTGARSAYVSTTTTYSNSINTAGALNGAELFVNDSIRIDHAGDAALNRIRADGSITTAYGFYTKTDASSGTSVCRISNTGDGAFASLSCTSLTVNGNSPIFKETYGGYSGSVNLSGNLNALNIYSNGTKRISSDGAATFSSCKVGGYDVLTTNSGVAYALDLIGVAYTGTYANSDADINGKRLCVGGWVVVTNERQMVNMAGCNLVSDKKLKKEITEFKNSAIEMIESVPVKSFTWKDSNKKVPVGFIAQDLEKLDEECKDQDLYDGFVNEYNDTKQISMTPMVALLWKAVQELSQEVKDLKEALKNAG